MTKHHLLSNLLVTQFYCFVFEDYFLAYFTVVSRLSTQVEPVQFVRI
jgi:hypothetical protein